MLISLVSVFALLFCAWSVYSKNRTKDYLCAVGMTLVLAILLINTVSVMSSSVIITICFILLILLFSTSKATGEKDIIRVYKSYKGKIIIFLVLITIVFVSYKQVLIKNLTYNSIDVNEDLIVMIILFFVSLSFKKIERKL
jgi:hypothetical protein